MLCTALIPNAMKHRPASAGTVVFAYGESQPAILDPRNTGT
jgi:hypothetical protein